MTLNRDIHGIDEEASETDRTASPSGMPGGPGESTPCAYTEYEPGEVPDDYPRTGEDAEGVAADVWERLYAVEDPEMPVSVVDLGLVYDVVVLEHDDGDTGTIAHVEMTLTYTGCPARDFLTNDVRCAAETTPGVDAAEVHVRFTPEWTVDMVTETGREALREFGLSV